MTLGGILLMVAIAAICGGMAQAVVGYTSGGCIVSTFIGFVGAILGWWIAGYFGLPLWLLINIQGRSFPVFWSIVGGAIFVAVLNLLGGRRKSRQSF